MKQDITTQIRKKQATQRQCKFEINWPTSGTGDRWSHASSHGILRELKHIQLKYIYIYIYIYQFPLFEWWLAYQPMFLQPGTGMCPSSGSATEQVALASTSCQGPCFALIYFGRSEAAVAYGLSCQDTRHFSDYGSQITKPPVYRLSCETDILRCRMLL